MGNNESQDVDMDEEGFDEDALESFYQRCEAMMEHLDLGQNDTTSDELDSEFREEHSHLRSPVIPCSPNVSSENSDGPALDHISMCFISVSLTCL